MENKNKALLISILVVLLLLVAVSVSLAIYVIRNFGKINAGDTAPTDVPQTSVQELTNDQITKYDIKDQISTNLLMTSDNTNHSIRLMISLGINNTDAKASADFIAKLPTEEALIKDVVNTVIRNKTYQDMMRAGADDIVKQEILARLQETYSENLLVAVYISGVYII